MRRAIRRRYGHASAAVTKSAAWLARHPIVTAAAIGAAAGAAAGMTGAAIGTVIGAGGGVAIEQITKS